MLIEGKHTAEGVLGDEGYDIPLLRPTRFLGKPSVCQAIGYLGREGAKETLTGRELHPQRA